MTGVLCSPYFLFRVEPAPIGNKEKVFTLDDYALASRLSYFLWSTMPDEELMSREMRANRLNWISLAGIQSEIRVKVKIRHRHEPAWATLRMSGEDEVTAIFDECQRAITPGQSAVFYDGDDVVGGGWIV